MLKILVTGGTGYIGSHTCVELLNEGYEVVIVDNFSNSKPEVLNRIRQITNKDFTFYEVDILKKDSLEYVFNANNIDAVIHFAGLKSVGESVKNPLKYYQTNLVGTISLCEMMIKYKVKKLVFSSSAAVYGNPEVVPIKEDSSLKPINPYGRTKLIIENMLRDVYNADNEWSIALLRYFNPIGAHESGIMGEDPKNIPSNLMPNIIQVALGEADKLKVFGNDYDTYDGTGVRDYIHVMDLAKGHVKALEKIMRTKGVDVFNLGTGVGYSVLDIINNFEKATGVEIPYTIVNRRSGDVDYCYADPKKAYKDLGWKAEKNLKDMCRDAWNWYKNNSEGRNN